MSNKNPNNLVNKDNYKKNFNNQKTDLYIKNYIIVIRELFDNLSKNIKINNIYYHKYIIIKGIQNITYIYMILSLYTKNIEIVLHHTHKAIIYYVEFIGQIGDTNHSFLQLSSNDASIFLYRKTIYDINNDFRQLYDINDNNSDKKFLENYSFHINIIKKTFNYYIEFFIVEDNWDDNYKLLIKC